MGCFRLHRTTARGRSQSGHGSPTYIALRRACTTCVLDRTRMNGNVAVGVAGYPGVGGSVQIVQGGDASIERSCINSDLPSKEDHGAWP